MNRIMIGHLVAKDWAFHRKATSLGCLVGVGALALLGVSSQGTFYAGSVLLISVIVTLGIYFPIVTVVQERTEGILPFVMSLPIAVPEYTMAKLLANALLFMVPWLLLTAGALALILGSDALPDGLLSFTAVTMLHLATAFVLILATALISESMEWTIAIGGGLNLVVQGFLYWVSHIPEIAGSMLSPAVVWTNSATLIMVGELVLIGIVLWLTWWIQGRKKDFV